MMKKGLLIPLAVLMVMLAFCIWNGAAMSSLTSRWQSQLESADRLARLGDWEGAAAAVQESYDEWTTRQTYLHIVTNHEVVDSAEAMYHRAMAFAGTKEDSEFRAELADLQDQLRLLAEMEELSLRNVL